MGMRWTPPMNTCAGYGYGDDVDFDMDTSEENKAMGGGGKGSFPAVLPRSGGIGNSGPGPMNQKRGVKSDDYDSDESY